MLLRTVIPVGKRGSVMYMVWFIDGATVLSVHGAQVDTASYCEDIGLFQFMYMTLLSCHCLQKYHECQCPLWPGCYSSRQPIWGILEMCCIANSDQTCRLLFRVPSRPQKYASVAFMDSNTLLHQKGFGNEGVIPRGRSDK